MIGPNIFYAYQYPQSRTLYRYFQKVLFSVLNLLCLVLQSLCPLA